jgi:Flp pilus assembly protein TadD
MGDYEKAAADFSAAIERNPKRARYYSHRGLNLYRLGQVDEAQKDFDQALALEVDNNIFSDLAVRSVLIGNFAEAIPYLRKALELDRQETLESLQKDKDFDSIRETPEFQVLLKEFETPA